MKSMGIRSEISKKLKVFTTDFDHLYSSSNNLLDRNFTSSRAAEKWVSAITYVRTQQGCVYLTVVMDLFERKTIGWSMSNTLESNPTIVAALLMALGKRPGNPNELIFNSDRGVQFAWEEFSAILQKHTRLSKL